MFKYLDIKDIESFKLIPDDDKCKVDSIDIEIFKFIPENQKANVLVYLDR